MWAQNGHIQCTHSMHLLGELGHAPAMKIFEIIHFEIASEANFWPETCMHHSFRMLASCPHESNRTC